MEPAYFDPPEDTPPVSAEFLVDGRQMTPEEELAVDERRYPSTRGGAFYLGVLAWAFAALCVAIFGSWLWGLTLLGLALIFASGARLMIDPLHAGMLAVRNQWVDSALLAGTGLVLIGISWSLHLELLGT